MSKTGVREEGRTEIGGRGVTLDGLLGQIVRRQMRTDTDANGRARESKRGRGRWRSRVPRDEADKGEELTTRKIDERASVWAREQTKRRKRESETAGDRQR